MPHLSVIIVSYNSLAFLKLCLHSLMQNSAEKFEVIVIDNNSSEDVVGFLNSHYPNVVLLANNENVGFGRACNQGMTVAKGDYFVFLNPDTIVSERMVDNVLEYMLANPDCGAMGVKMLDGNGLFLPESKRGLPTLWRSAFRLTGLTALFPKSALFSGYYLGHLSPDEAHDIDVLAGAFMVVRADVAKRCGGFNELFFMYGEDIDFSWRIKQAGYRVVYNPSIVIVHFKGESTLKNYRYLKIFYSAMRIFYNLHFKRKREILLKHLINGLTYMMIGVSWLASVLKMGRFKQINIPRIDRCTVISNGSVVELQSFAPLKHSVVCSSTEGLTAFPNSVFAVIDLSSVVPSQAIDMVEKSQNRYKGFLWLSPDRNELFFPLSASTNTPLFSLHD